MDPIGNNDKSVIKILNINARRTYKNYITGRFKFILD